MSNYDNYKELCTDLTLEVQELRSQVEEAAAALNEERRKRLEAEAHVAILERNEELRHPTVIPTGDEDEGYSCPVPGCWVEIDHPFEQPFCAGCGARFDWHPEPPEPDCDGLRDRLADEALMGGDAA